MLGPTGRVFTPESIGMAVAMRDLNQHLRETGESKGYNAGFTPKDRSRFLERARPACPARHQGRGGSPLTRCMSDPRRAMARHGFEPMTFLARQHRHLPFYYAVVTAVVVLSLAAWLRPGLAVEAGANAFFLVYLVLSAIKIPKLTAAFLKKHAAGADEPVPVIFAVTLGAVVVAVASLFVLINESGPRDPVQLGLSLASVALGWFTIHTMAALHYAHIYWRPDDDSPTQKQSPSPLAAWNFRAQARRRAGTSSISPSWSA